VSGLKNISFSRNKTATSLIYFQRGYFVAFSGCYRRGNEQFCARPFLPGEFSIGIPIIMNITSISHRPIGVGGSLAAALLAAGLQLLLVALPIRSLRAGGANEERNAFTWNNLQSDIAGVADRTDLNLVNSWGLVINPTASIFWVADNGSGVSTLYRPDGTPVNLIVAIPTTPADLPPSPGTPPSATPTGIVFNPFATAFVLPDGQPATFIFDGEDGGISAWNPELSPITEAILVSDNSPSDAVYKGLALATRTSGGPTLYATNFHNGTVDVFDSSFHLVTTLPATAFKDPNLPANFAPFGIANIDGQLYVTFALQKLPDRHDDQAGPGNGFVDVFDANDGHLVKRLISKGQLNSPWGLARVPREFGKFRHKFGGFGPSVLLVGNFGDGKINAFGINSGNFIDPLKNRRGDPLDFNGLWALFFLDERLYFTAGIGDESHGLFGVIKSVDKEKEEDSHE
jgi:uncharacterized protein (TIGR03118 family)